MFPGILFLNALHILSIFCDIACLLKDTYVRPMYAGNALAKVKAKDALKVLSIRPTSFDKTALEDAGAVESVSNTNLFARSTGRGTQLLVYQMDFKSEAENAMILPLPVATPAREKHVRFIALDQYDVVGQQRFAKQ